MIRIILFCFCALLSLSSTYAKNFEKDGLKYEIKGKRVAVSSAVDRDASWIDLEIPYQITIKGETYTVTAINHLGFANSPNLRSVIIPNSVESIGAAAFADCYNLVSVILPDNLKIEEVIGFYGMTDTRKPFAGCTSLSEIRGYNVGVPSYVLESLLKDCKEVPFYNIGRNSHNEILASTKSKGIPFIDYVKSKVELGLEEWQKRKEYETEQQWLGRVNEQTRQERIEDLMNEAKDNYIQLYAPNKIYGSLGTYDSEYNIFPVQSQFGSLYVHVPADEANYFKQNWDRVLIEPTYGIINSEVGISECAYVLDGKHYSSPQTYRMDEISVSDFGIPPIESYITGASNQRYKDNSKIINNISDIVDTDIPSSGIDNDKTFAVIIGNEKYARGVAPVDFAMNDAKVFAKYCNKTLGIPEKNIRTYMNATYGDMLAAMRDIDDIAKAYKGKIKVLFYYAGHGLPDESTREPYLLPVDADGHTTDGLYSLNKLYKQLADLNAEKTIAFIDACFSGSTRGDDMLMAARGVRRKPSPVRTEGNVVAISATSGQQTAYPYKEKGHGLFTYYLLDKLRQTKGNVTVGDLYEHILDNVSQQSVVTNRKSQVPSLMVSPEVNASWSSIKL